MAQLQLVLEPWSSECKCTFAMAGSAEAKVACLLGTGWLDEGLDEAMRDHKPIS